MPRRPANRKAKKSTPKSKEDETQSSVAMDDTIVSEEVDLSSSLVKDSKGSEPSRIETEEVDELPNNVLEEQGIIEKVNEGLEENAMEDEGLLMSEVVEVKVKEEEVGFQEEKIGDIAVEDYSNLTCNGSAVVLEDSSNLNGELIEKEKHSDAAVVEDDSNLNSRLAVEENNMNLNSEDSLAKGCVAGKEREAEAGKNAGECDQNGNDTLGINQDGDTNSVEEETPAAHGEETIVLGDGDDICDVKKGSDMEGEGEKIENSDEEDEEYNEENGASEYLVLGDGSNFHVEKKGTGMEGEGKKSEDCVDSDAEEDEDNEEDEHISEFINRHLPYRKTEKILEIHVGGLDKAAIEEDLIKIFAKFGEIQDVRIARNSTTKKSKGFGFIRYVTVEQAKNALAELKDGIKVRGKQVRISASQGNDTLYMRNICRTWRKEKVLETLKGFGIQQVQEIYLPDDPEKDGKNKGFAFLEFSTHTSAMAAFQRLRKPDAIFGRARSAKVAFPPHPSEEVLSQIKTVDVKGLPDSWDEAKVKEICKQYGEIERVKLSRNLKRKCKDFGFITFTSRESALACIEGINSSQIGEGEVEIKANMAKPHSKDHSKGHLQMFTRGGFKVEMEDHTKAKGAKQEINSREKAGSSKMKGHARSGGAEKMGKELAKEKGKAFLSSESGKGGKSNKHQSSLSEDQGNDMPSKPDKRNGKRKNLPSKLDGRGRRDVDHGYSKRPSKKARGDMRGKQGNMFRNPRSQPHFREGPVYVANSVAYRNPYATRYDASATSYPGHVYGASSGSKRHHSDMEPHAGFLEPAVGGKQGQPHARHVEPALGTQGQPHVRYVEPVVRKVHAQAGHVEPHLGRQVRRHAGYIEPALGTQSLPHAGYLGPAVGNQAHNPYDYEPRRVGRYDGQGSLGSAYAGGSALPSSHVPNYTSYAGYEGGASVGNYYHSSRSAQQPRRSYY